MGDNVDQVKPTLDSSLKGPLNGNEAGAVGNKSYNERVGDIRQARKDGDEEQKRSATLADRLVMGFTSTAEFKKAFEEVEGVDEVEVIINKALNLIHTDIVAFEFALQNVSLKLRGKIIELGKKFISEDADAFRTALEYAPQGRKDEVLDLGKEFISKNEWAFRAALEHAPQGRKNEVFELGKALISKDARAFRAALAYAPQGRKDEVLELGRKIIFRNKGALFLVAGYRYRTKKARSIIAQNLENFFQEELGNVSLDLEDLSFLVNCLPTIDSRKYGRKVQAEKAREWLDSKDVSAFLRKKACLLLVAWGVSVSELKDEHIALIFETLRTQGAIGVDISNMVRDSHYLAIARKLNMAVSSYMSVLVAMRNQLPENTSEAEKHKLFQRIINMREEIKDTPFMEGEHFLPVVHAKGDPASGYFSPEDDSFTPDPYIRIAQKSGLEILPTARFGEDTNVTQMLDRIKESPGPLALLIGGHGEKGSIHFGGEEMLTNQLFEALASDPVKVSMIILHSCFSDFNARSELLSRWSSDSRTRSFMPPIMLSSSNDEKVSNVIVNDAWYYFANYTDSLIRTPTWNDFWRHAEGRMMILSSFNYVYPANSDPAIFYPVMDSEGRSNFLQIGGESTKKSDHRFAEALFGVDPDDPREEGSTAQEEQKGEEVPSSESAQNWLEIGDSTDYDEPDENQPA